MTSDWRPTHTPEQRYLQNRATANIGLVSSVGRAPARQFGGRRFKIIDNPALTLVYVELVNFSLFIQNSSDDLIKIIRNRDYEK